MTQIGNTEPRQSGGERPPLGEYEDHESGDIIAEQFRETINGYFDAVVAPTEEGVPRLENGVPQVTESGVNFLRISTQSKVGGFKEVSRIIDDSVHIKKLDALASPFAKVSLGRKAQELRGRRGMKRTLETLAIEAFFQEPDETLPAVKFVYVTQTQSAGLLLPSSQNRFVRPVTMHKRNDKPPFAEINQQAPHMIQAIALALNALRQAAGDPSKKAAPSEDMINGLIAVQSRRDPHSDKDSRMARLIDRVVNRQ